MTGWRVGWMVVPDILVRPIERLQQNLSISVPSLSQIAAEAAFDGAAEMEEIKHGYQENRRILIEGLPKAGLTQFLPADGAFYLYADVSDFTSDSFDFAKQMLDQAGVAATPGLDFDPIQGRSFIRLSYARSAAEMREAVDRIEEPVGAVARALPPQRCAAVHGDGRDGGGGADRGRRRPRRPHGGRPARAGAPPTAIAAAQAALGQADRLYRGARHSLAAGRASRGIIGTPMASRSDPERMMVTTGSSGGFILAFLSLFDPGDRVALANPGYPPYRHILTALGCEPVLIETSRDAPRAAGEALIAAHRKTPLKGVLVAAPPTRPAR